MTIAALESIASGSKSERQFGGIVLAGVMAKCVIEQITGEVLFADCHLGNVGLPVVSCHLGGTLGGAVSPTSRIRG
jgi:hypothetical protein